MVLFESEHLPPTESMGLAIVLAWDSELPPLHTRSGAVLKFTGMLKT